MSVWEYRAARARLKQQGFATANNELVRRAISELRDQVDESEARTKKARRAAQRRREHERKVRLGVPEKRQDSPPPTSGDLVDGAVDPAWEIE